MKKTEISVIGAGIVGLSSAINLVKRGSKVTLIEKDLKGQPASYGNASWLSSPSITPVLMPGMFKKIPKMWLSKDGPLFLRFPGVLKMIPFLIKYLSYTKKEKVEHISKNLAFLLKDSIGEHRELVKGSKAERWIEDSPFLFIYKNKTDFENDSYTWSLRKKHGFELVEVQKEELNKIFPGLSQEYTFAIKIENQGYISNSQNYLDDLIDYYKSLGGEIIEDEVLDVNSSDDYFTIKLRNSDLFTEKVLISSGVYSGNFVKKFNVKVPIESERGYHLELFDTNIRINHPIMNGYLKLAITPRPTGIRFAGLVEFGSINSKPNPKAFELLMRNAQSMFPGITFKRKMEWSGHRPSTVDSLPVIGASERSNNLFFAYGHHHIGLTAGPKTGKMIAKQILRDNDKFDLDAFNPHR
ncbi:NAD(P)/FAD-dependent oxidoreductase [Candidatus Pelagibacter sp. HIMB1321]|uniref:NAD(P)/FAD-dependent oxidoreductase n=1 Tax=Candidatus Pelagibacter sp. HIMB1321 TaxID=1388755 RepID=UPI000A08085A|nr:FAD-binding oxidoreductase [Candidatus Pelagibacter sp. HIMB1321]SMF73456.1 D-amino-acid dehydrogenase [Candidatus Pelagibacter sp. HIMB1321]